ncbi:MAG: tripartite tricarboxylate transporter substrate binding protein [Betaproteobacteria bacterium]|nr:tripartite tricarboxylate transporter substrate binding protein [Betaproteobacteria bacterium]
MRTVQTIACAQILVASIVLGGVAGAQDFPSRPIRIVVPSTPGTSPDHVGRIIATEMARNIGQPVIVENKPSADALLAYEYVAKLAGADGYTVGIINVPGLAGLPATVKNLRFDPLKDLPPVIGLVETKYLFGSSVKFPWKDFKELIAYAKENPGKLNYASLGPNLRLLMEVLVQDQGLNVVNIPYNGGGPYTQALLTGEVQMGYLGESTAINFSDKFRSIATTGRNRHAPFMSVPTFAELGYPQIRGPSFSLNVAAGVPKAALERLLASARQALQQQEVKDRFQKLQFEIVDLSPEAANKQLLEEAELYSSIARKAGIQPN